MQIGACNETAASCHRQVCRKGKLCGSCCLQMGGGGGCGLYQEPRSVQEGLAQFDGSCHKETQVGGAGVVVWAPQSLPAPIEVHAIPIAACTDSFQAELVAAHEAVGATISQCEKQGNPSAIIQGDCLCMIRRFTGAYRVGRPDLAHLLQDVWSRIASTHVQVRWSYIPRAGNRVADFLAGAASDFLLPRGQQASSRYEESGFVDADSSDFAVRRTSHNIEALSSTVSRHRLLHAIQSLTSFQEAVYLLSPPVHNPEVLATYAAVHRTQGLPGNLTQIETFYERASSNPQLDTTPGTLRGPVCLSSCAGWDLVPMR